MPPDQNTTKTKTHNFNTSTGLTGLKFMLLLKWAVKLNDYDLSSDQE